MWDDNLGEKKKKIPSVHKTAFQVLNQGLEVKTTGRNTTTHKYEESSDLVVEIDSLKETLLCVVTKKSKEIRRCKMLNIAHKTLKTPLQLDLQAFLPSVTES